ncbi:MAG: glycosyltransferase family 2 protein [Clostridium sp.]
MIKGIVTGVNIFFMYYMFIYSAIFFISTIYSMVDIQQKRIYRKNRRLIKNNNNYVPISILVPAYNEEKTIVDSVKSILNSNYKDYEIIVVSDGSTDYTPENLIKAFSLKQIVRPIRKVIECNEVISIHQGEQLINNKQIRIILICKENGGKADALNMGINVARYPIIISLDADSFLSKDALTNIVTPFIENENTIAVGGNIKVANHVKLENGEIKSIKTPKKYLAIMQMIEYYRVFLTTRVWFNSFNGNLIISGAFGAFKKQAVLNVGGYNSKSIGEDMEIVVKLHSFYKKNKKPYKIEYVSDAICWSQVPTTLSDLKSQRKRWHIGLMESLLSHKYIFLNYRYGLSCIFAFLYFLFYEMLSCVIEVVGLVFIIISISVGLINIKFMMIFIVLYFTFGLIVSVASIMLENNMFKEKLSLKIIIKLIFYSILEQVGYRQISSFYRLIGFLSYKKRGDRWQKIERTSFE